jgi:hypothetical protein
MIYEKKVGNDMIRVQYDDPIFKITLLNEHSKAIKTEAVSDAPDVLSIVTEFAKLSDERKATRDDLKTAVRNGLLNIGFSEN